MLGTQTGKEVLILRDPRNGDSILSQSAGNLREVLAALHKLDIPDDFLSPSERTEAQKSKKTELWLSTE